MSPDRYGDQEPAVDGAAEHRCDGGWIDRDADKPVPCLVCKPHLAPANRVRLNGS